VVVLASGGAAIRGNPLSFCDLEPKSIRSILMGVHTHAIGRNSANIDKNLQGETSKRLGMMIDQR